MTSCFESLREKHLQWLPELGMGYFPVRDQPYDARYWLRYRDMDRTPVADALTAMRVQFVRNHYAGTDLCDVGIGGGRFLEESGARGYDVNPSAVQWLTERNRWIDPYFTQVRAATFWDSLEHISDPTPLLAHVREWAFVSIPIFRSPEHVLSSKHYRRDEHFLYFTRAGFEAFMARHGFRLVEWSDMEQSAGREDIHSFAFRRDHAC